MIKVKIDQFAGYAPSFEVSNDDLSQIMDTSDEWISTRTGIKKRRISLNENTSELCTKVAQQLVSKANINVDEIGLIIVATMSPDACTPSTASLVQGAINATNAVAFDISAACSGFIYGMEIAQQMMRCGQQKYSLIIGGEVLSKEVNWKDRTTAVLFGDGAGGVLLEANDLYGSFAGTDLKTFGKLGNKLVAGETHPIGKFPSKEFTKFNPFEMDGRSVYKFATTEVPRSIKRVCTQNNITLDQVDYFILHQANIRIIKSIAKKLDQPLSKFPSNVDHYGNTSAASIPLLLSEMEEKRELHHGQTIVLSGFGGGLTIGSQIIKL